MLVDKLTAKEVGGRLKSVAFLLISLSISFSVLHPVFGTLVEGDNYTSCNCVVFRMDDLQDHWINDTQILLMDTFIDRGLNLTLGLIMHNIGNDSGVVSKISEGYKKGLFELALHGWDHVDYTKLNGEEQRVSLLKANEKMQKLFGNKSDVFIPPFNEFNNETLKAMSKVHMTVLSSSLYEEDNFDQGKSIFLAKDRASNGSSTNNNSDYTPFTSLSSSDTASPNVINTSIYKINHLPTTIEFESYHNNSWVKIPVDKILTDTFDSIVKYGYSVILLQPQSFITPDSLGRPNFTKQEIDAESFRDLSLVIDNLLNKKVKIESLYDVAN